MTDVRGSGTASATLGALIEAAPDGVFLADTVGRMLVVNRRMGAMFRYPKAALQGQPVTLLVPAYRHGAHRRARGRDRMATSAADGLAGGPLLGRRQDGTEFPVALSIGALHAGEGIVAVGTVRDMTDHVAQGPATEGSGPEQRRPLRDEVLHVCTEMGAALGGVPVVRFVGPVETVDPAEHEAFAAMLREFLSSARRRGPVLGITVTAGPDGGMVVAVDGPLAPSPARQGHIPEPTTATGAYERAKDKGSAPPGPPPLEWRVPSPPA